MLINIHSRPSEKSGWHREILEGKWQQPLWPRLKGPRLFLPECMRQGPYEIFYFWTSLGTFLDHFLTIYSLFKIIFPHLLGFIFPQLPFPLAIFWKNTPAFLCRLWPISTFLLPKFLKLYLKLVHFQAIFRKIMTTLSTCLLHENNKKGVRDPRQENFENSYLWSSIFDPFF